MVMTPSTAWDPGPRESRAYVHRACGHSTLVSGTSFERLSHPFTPVGGETWCGRCRGHANLRDFAWDDTGETLAARRCRLRRASPWSVRIVSLVLSPLLAVVVVGVIVRLVAPLLGLGGVIPGGLGLNRADLIALLCAAVAPKWAVQFLTPPLTRRACGVDFRRIQ